MTKTPKIFQTKKFILPLILIWLLLVLTGLFYLSRYSNIRGKVGITSRTWPKNSSISRKPGQPTLVLFAHPKCACSRATAAEFERLAARIDGHPVTMVVVLFKPKNADTEWANTGLKEKFDGIPHVVTILDEDGVEAKKFGALTSGQTFLYDKEGELLFQGGITSSRGHEGDSAGRDGVVALIRGEKTPISTSPVFGCSIRKPASEGWKAN